MTIALRNGARWLTLGLLLGAAVSRSAATADWPMLRGDPARRGLATVDLARPARLAWAVEFNHERLGTAMEPIVADGRVFVATHRGHLYALDAASGRPHWRFAAPAPFLHSPALEGAAAILGDAAGGLYAVDAVTGTLRWQRAIGRGGFSASPCPIDGSVFLGTRDGTFLALDAAEGRTRWERDLGAPVRQSAAAEAGDVFVTAEDLRLHCLDARTGTTRWTSTPMAGQTARDYYPVLARREGRRFAIVRTNPVRTMSAQIARDRHVLCQAAGVDDRDWRTIDAWTRSDAARGTPALWEQEQRAIVAYLRAQPEAQTFHVFDAATGEACEPAPVLWVAGCQAVGVQPALLPDGRLLVLYRSAYGHWTHGVAPLVALGVYDPSSNRVTPLEHTHGPRPPWNVFWGTADESQNFVVTGDRVLIVHQGTLSGFDLTRHALFPIWGERDTYGGFRSPRWARNEWHGPARGGVAVAGEGLYWLTGSRVLALAFDRTAPPPAVVSIDAREVHAPAPPPLPRSDADTLRRRLAAAVQEVLAQRWAPLYVEPGLAGREFFFADSGEFFGALVQAHAALPPASPLRARIQEALAAEWERHPPFTAASQYPLHEGARREPYAIPADVLNRVGPERPPHPLGHFAAVERYARECDAWPRVLDAWPRLQATFQDFARTGWKLEADRGDLYANRYYAGLRACGRIATRAGDDATAARANAWATEIGQPLVAWWRRAAERGTLQTFQGSSELDPFIGQGDAFSFRLAPHRHKLALFHDFNPDVGALLHREAADALESVWQTFERLYATWPLQGEERQVHSGENFVDPPDLAADAFRVLAWGRHAPAATLERCLDIPWGRADLYHLIKLSLTLQAQPSAGTPSPTPSP